MKKLFATLLLACAVIGARAATVTANDTFWVCYWEFSPDPAGSVGPDYQYDWVPNGLTLFTSTGHYTGPGWLRTEYDADWNRLSRTFTAGYSIDMPEASTTLMFQSVIEVGVWNTPEYTRTVFWGDLCAAATYWESLGGTFTDVCLPEPEPELEPTAPQSPGKGKKLGHLK
jgi:hypothetical protein